MNVHVTSNDRVSSSWFIQLNLDKPFCLAMLDKILDLQRCVEGREGGKEGREEGRKVGRERQRRRRNKGGYPGGRKRKGKSKRMEGKRRRERGRGTANTNYITKHNPQLCKPLWLYRGGWDDLPGQDTLHTRY